MNSLKNLKVIKLLYSGPAMYIYPCAVYHIVVYFRLFPIDIAIAT